MPASKSSQELVAKMAPFAMLLTRLAAPLLLAVGSNGEYQTAVSYSRSHVCVDSRLLTKRLHFVYLVNNIIEKICYEVYEHTVQWGNIQSA